MNLWHDVSIGENAPERFMAVVEISRGSLNKYELDKESGLIMLDRVSHTAQTYPFDYAMVPQTLWEDGDPLDVMIMTTEPIPPGVLVEVRPVGVMHMIDDGEGDDKILAVPVGDKRFDHVQDIGDVSPHLLKTYQHFYENYKKLQNKVVEIPGIEGKEAAMAAVEKSVTLYNEKFGA